MSIEKVYDKDGLRYEGELKDGKYSGKGKSYHKNGILEYEGDFRDGKFNGTGKLYRIDRTLMFHGQFVDGEFVKDPLSGPLKYIGDIQNGKFHGKGRLFYEDGISLLYDGEFSDGKFNGTGRTYDRQGKLIFNGQWDNGSFVFANPVRSEHKAEIELFCIDDETTPFSTFQSHNQKLVRNRNGIFMTYHKSRNDTYTAQHWRLMRSSDEGKSFEEVFSMTAPTNPPCIETDDEDNIYLIYPNFLDGNSYLMIFKASEEYKNPTVTTIPDSASGKFCMAYDASRRQLYYFSSLVPNPSSAHVQAAKRNTFTILDTQGNIIAFIPLITTGKTAKVEYPQLYADPSGRLHAAWTTENMFKPYLYWSVHHISSSDGGLTWNRMDGKELSLPIASDETGESDLIISEDEFDCHTWLSSFTCKDDKLHFIYSPSYYDPNRFYTGSVVQWEHYQRIDALTGVKDHEINPVFGGEHIKAFGADGFFAHDSRVKDSVLYYISRQGNRIICLSSSDNGLSWNDHSMSAELQDSIYAVGGCREVTEDGYIMGAFTQRLVDENYSDVFAKAKTYFFRIKV